MYEINLIIIGICIGVFGCWVYINYEYNMRINNYKNPSSILFDKYENPITFINMRLIRTDISNETKDFYNNIKNSYNAELLSNLNNIKTINSFYNNIIVKRINKDYTNETNELINKFTKNKVRNEQIKIILSNIINFFEIIPDDEGSIGDIDSILYMYEMGFLSFYKIPREIAHDVHSNDFTNFIIYFNKMIKYT